MHYGLNLKKKDRYRQVHEKRNKYLFVSGSVENHSEKLLRLQHNIYLLFSFVHPLVPFVRGLVSVVCADVC